MTPTLQASLVTAYIEAQRLLRISLEGNDGSGMDNARALIDALEINFPLIEAAALEVERRQAIKPTMPSNDWVHSDRARRGIRALARGNGGF